MNLTNYEVMRNQMREEFVKYDQEAMIDKFTLKNDETYLYIMFVSRNYRIHRQNGVVEWSEDGFTTCVEAGYNESMTIYDMLCYSKAGCRLSGRFVPISMLKGIVHTSTDSLNSLFQRSADGFSGKTKALESACGVLGKPADIGGDVAAILYPFAFLPVTLQYWDADDEFPANLKFMTDENILDFIHYETIFLMMGHIISRLDEIMNCQANL